MSGRFSFTPKQSDLLTALKAHHTLFPFKRIGVFLVFSAFVGLLVSAANVEADAQLVLITMAGFMVFGALVFGLIQIIIRLWWMPRYAARVYQQQLELRQAVTVDFDQERFSTASESGHFTVAWPDLHQWKRTEQMMLLYRSEALFNFIPLDADERRLAADAMQSLLIAAGVKQAP